MNSLTDAQCRARLEVVERELEQERKDRKQEIAGLQARVKFTESFESVQHKAHRYWEIARLFHNALVGAGNAGAYNFDLQDEAIRLFDIEQAEQLGIKVEDL